MNLKDLLLGSRDSLPGRFSNMTESQALDIAIGVTKGMAHLEANKVIFAVLNQSMDWKVMTRLLYNGFQT